MNLNLLQDDLIVISGALFQKLMLEELPEQISVTSRFESILNVQTLYYVLTKLQRTIKNMYKIFLCDVRISYMYLLF